LRLKTKILPLRLQQISGNSYSACQSSGFKSFSPLKIQNSLKEKIKIRQKIYLVSFRVFSGLISLRGYDIETGFRTFKQQEETHEIDPAAACFKIVREYRIPDPRCACEHT